MSYEFIRISSQATSKVAIDDSIIELSSVEALIPWLLARDTIPALMQFPGLPTEDQKWVRVNNGILQALE
jgi:hypothetical protein